MRKTFGYIRCSGIGQMEGDGPIRQRAAIEQFAGLNQIEVVSWFTEAGVSGKNDYDDRPAMREMFAQLNGVNTVIVERLDRLARDLIIQEGIIARFRDGGIELLSTAEDNLCSDDPTRVFIRQVLGAVAQLDRSLIVKKLRAARDRKRANGRCEGRKRFGDKPGETVVLARMNLAVADGFNAEGIAEMLNLDDTSTRSGKPWRASVIRKILKREVQSV